MATPPPPTEKGKKPYPTHPDPAAPYKPGVLHPPLTVVQYNAITKYLDQFSKDWEKAYKRGQVDDALIVQYEAISQAIYNTNRNPLPDTGGPGFLPGQSGLPGSDTVFKGINSVADFLKLLTTGEFWTRAVEVAIGLLLIAVGAAKMSNTASAILQKVPIAGKVMP